MSVYTDNGFKNRKEYLDSLAKEYNPEIVYMLADLLGPIEDFDGLVTELEDFNELDAESGDSCSSYW